MKESNRQDRRRAIEDAAARLLVEKGFAATSMLAVAKEAKASNETLYRWYGDKLGLFQALVARNSQTVADTLAASAQAGLPPRTRLEQAGPALLAMLLAPQAIALNRAAAADETGALGRALAQAGRETVAPLITEVIARAVDTGDLSGDPAALAAVYLRLLIGDSQIRRVTGATPPPTAEWIAAQSAQALALLDRLAGPGAAENSGRPALERLPDGKDPERL